MPTTINDKQHEALRTIKANGGVIFSNEMNVAPNTLSALRRRKLITGEHLLCITHKGKILLTQLHKEQTNG